MNAYSYNENMEYIGTVECQKDPVRSDKEKRDVWLLPANSTFTAPPDFDQETQKAVWDGEAWHIEALPEPEPASVDSIKAEKIAEIKKDCEEYIYAGTSVTYTDGATEHFTYNLADQSNISEMFTAVMAGATEYPYHARSEEHTSELQSQR